MKKSYIMIHYYRYLFVKMKVFNYSELHFSEGTSFKIHTLGILKFHKLGCLTYFIAIILVFIVKRNDHKTEWSCVRRRQLWRILMFSKMFSLLLNCSLKQPNLTMAMSVMMFNWKLIQKYWRNHSKVIHVQAGVSCTGAMTILKPEAR